MLKLKLMHPDSTRLGPTQLNSTAQETDAFLLLLLLLLLLFLFLFSFHKHSTTALIFDRLILRYSLLVCPVPLTSSSPPPPPPPSHPLYNPRLFNQHKIPFIILTVPASPRTTSLGACRACLARS
jgi:hypothetical protein